MRTAPRLNRTTFRQSRLMDFFSRKELVAQTGHRVDDWPLVAVKELTDNATDACEDEGIPPVIDVKVDAGGITVADNGPGIKPEIIEGVRDFSVRVSSREAYVSPTRGAQGNALKTLLAMPFVLDSDSGRLDVETHGTCHAITVRVDRIRQMPVIDYEQRHGDEFVRTGTRVRLHWPQSACSILERAWERFLQIVNDYAFLNPHLTLAVDWFGESSRMEATTPAWPKWLPSEPTCPHWYGEGEDFDRLVAGYIAEDADKGTDRTVRAFLAEFGGLTGSANQKKVLDATGLARVNLSALRDGDDLNRKLTARLLGAMKAQTKPVKPDRLGVIGQQHLATRFKALGCEMKTFNCKKVLGETDGLPWVFETAFAWCPSLGNERRLITGVNWSPGIVNPFRQLGRLGEGMDGILKGRWAGPNEPVVLLLHVACPRVQYTDRGKSALVMGGRREDSQPSDEEE
jgi:DNA topoisomerase VI subunit B